jgi:glyoxylase-like metal-dependent hydrolase (beta-lactamase superfamily II)
MTARIYRLVFALCLVVGSADTTSAQQMEHFRMEKINDRVYAFIGSDPTLDWVDGNSYAILTDDGVFVVDSHQPPIVAEANIDEIRKLTDKPIKYLLNTHWHGDHNTGNFVFKREYPDIQIIAHTKTREILVRRMPQWVVEARNGEYAKYIKMFDSLLAVGKGFSGRSLDATDSLRLNRCNELLRKYDLDVRRDTAVLPFVTFNNRLTIHLGGVEIQIRHDCRANTPGDAYVWLPQDSILITGDILVHPIPYPFGSFFDEWVTQLDTMLALHPKVICPGHGDVMHDTEYMQTVRDLFATIWSQGKAAFDRGITTPDSLKNAFDLGAFRTKMTGGDPVRDYLFRAYILSSIPPRLMRQFKNEIGDDLEAN